MFCGVLWKKKKHRLNENKKNMNKAVKTAGRSLKKYWDCDDSFVSSKNYNRYEKFRIITVITVTDKEIEGEMLAHFTWKSGRNVKQLIIDEFA